MLLTQKNAARGMALGAACDFHTLPVLLKGHRTALQMILVQKEEHLLSSFIIS